MDWINNNEAWPSWLCNAVLGAAIIPVCILIWLVSCPALGQVKPKPVPQEADYAGFGAMFMEDASPQGNWIAYTMRYDEAPDTLHVVDRLRTKNYKFADAVNWSFGDDTWFAVRENDGSLSVLDLQSGRVRAVPNIMDWAFTASGSYLAALSGSDEDGVLEVYDRAGKSRFAVRGAASFSLSPDGSRMIFARKTEGGSKAEILDLSTWAGREVKSVDAGTFTSFKWQPDGSTVGIMHMDKLNCLYSYNPSTKKLIEFPQSNLPSGRVVADAMSSRLTVAADGKILFGIDAVNKSDRFNPDSLQVWNGNDNWIYPERKNAQLWADLPLMAAWYPRTGKFVISNAPDRPRVFFNASYDYAVSFGYEHIGPQYTITPVADYYITNLATGKTTLWLERQSTAIGAMGISPGGRFAAYFRDGSYWIYDFQKGSTVRVTCCPRAAWFAEDQYGVDQLHGIAGWGAGDSSLLLNDESDVWSIALDGRTAVCLTEGFGTGYSYRLVNENKDNLNRHFAVANGLAFDLGKSLVFHRRSATHSAYMLKERNGKWITLDNGEFRASDMMGGKNLQHRFYMVQRYDLPPQIRVVAPQEKPSTIVESNDIKKFSWGRAELIAYKSPSGRSLSGVLYYPAGYDPAKKYPMVVSIYEMQSQYLHNFTNPSKYNSIGFNVTNMVLNGYFVLLPDLKPERNNPGVSAAHCTVAAVKEVLSRAPVDPGRIGLIGHSFGGYEANFVITQSNLFAAAVSGAGIADVPAHYLTVGWKFGHPEIFRYETQQWRMDHSLFADRESYERNSPVHQADKVSTPLLLWVGKKDRQVDWYQSIAYHLALRRLGKKHIMLVYPNEIHAVMQPQNQADLTRRIEQWFGYFLKGEAPEKWIIDGTG